MGMCALEVRGVGLRSDRAIALTLLLGKMAPSWSGRRVSSSCNFASVARGSGLSSARRTRKESNTITL